MPVGYHPNINDQGALIGALVTLRPAVGSLTISIVTPSVVTSEDGTETMAETTTEAPNPDYVPSDFATIAAIASELADRGHPVGPGFGVRELGFTGPHPDLEPGTARMYAQISVGDEGETARRDAFDAAVVAVG